MKTLAIVSVSLATLAVAVAACSGGTKTSRGPFKVTTGNWTVDTFNSISDDCNLNYDPSVYTFDVYDLGGGNYALQVPLDGSTTVPIFFTRNANALTSPDDTTTAHFQPIRYFGGGGAFCTATKTRHVTATVTSDDSIAVDVRWSYDAGTGPQCAAVQAPLPCTSEGVYHMNHTSTPSGPAPTPVATPAAVTGTIYAQPETDAGLVDYYVTGTYGSLAFGGTLNGDALAFTGHRWFCYGALPADNNVTNLGALADYSDNPNEAFYLTVTSSMWAAGSKTVDPVNSVYAELITMSNGLPYYDVIAQSGTVSLTTAGAVVDDPASRCNFSMTGVSVTGFKFPHAGPYVPHRTGTDAKLFREVDWPRR